MEVHDDCVETWNSCELLQRKAGGDGRSPIITDSLPFFALKNHFHMMSPLLSLI
jgi:hypothetical protein